jgi:large subunit ribosomal protein L25
VSEVKISAEPRTELGKGGARRTRRAGKVPAVLYGHGEPPKHISLPAREFAAAIRHGGTNQIFNISLADGTETLALPRSIQRHALKDTFNHVDLLIVKRGERVTVDVPVHLLGEAARGTLVIHEHDRLALSADALHLPDHLEASIEGLEAGTRVTAADVALPEGAELVGDPDTVVAIISVAPTAEELEGETAAEAPAEEGEGAEAPTDAEATSEPAGT